MKKNPWIKAPKKMLGLIDPIAEAHCPAVRFKPGDLWMFKGVGYHAAILRQPHRGRHIGLIRIVFRYIWRIPTKEEIRDRHPNWSESVVEGIHGRFRLHEMQWGPDDVEMVSVVLKRYPRGPSLDLMGWEEFVPIEVTIRNGAHFKGVLKQIQLEPWTWWKKIGQNKVTINLTDDQAEYFSDHLLLTIDSYHHSFFTFKELRDPETKTRVSSWMEIAIPQVKRFDARTWRYYQVISKKRGHEPWEV